MIQAMWGNPAIFHPTKSIEKKYWEKINIDTINKSSCTKLALSASWTHDLIADGLNWWPDMYIYLPKWPFYIICILYIINIIYIHIYIIYIHIYMYYIYIIYMYIYIYKMPKYQYMWFSSDLHLWFDVWVPTVTFSVNFLGKSLTLNFPKM